MKKLLSIILTILMFVTSVPFAFAADVSLVINMTDSYGDGWSGNAIQVGTVSGGEFTKIADVTFDEGATATYEAAISDENVYAFVWTKGSYAEECSFSIVIGGETVLEASDCNAYAPDGIIYTTCNHSFSDSICSICELECGVDFAHTMNSDSECTVCGFICSHSYTNHYCKTCKTAENGYYADVCGAENINDAIWSLDSQGTLTISGTGKYDVEYLNAPWLAYESSIKDVVIEEGITNIRQGSFYDLSNAVSLSIPSTVNEINAYGNNYFAEFKLAEGNSNYALIDGVLFNADKTELIMYPVRKADETYTVPAGVLILGNESFSFSENLKTINISDDVTTINESCFMYSSVETVHFGKNVNFIDYNAFCYSDIKNIVFPEKLTEMSSGMFYGCKYLENLVIGSNVISIEDDVITYCNALEAVHFTGTEAQWEAITKPEDETDKINTVPVHFGALEEKTDRDATCGADGHTAGLYCAECDDYVTGDIIPATGEHESYTDGVCDVCGYECTHESYTDGKCDSCGTEGTIVTIDMTDSYGDGWNGNAVVIKQLVDGVYTDTEAGTATIGDGVSGTFTTFLPKDGIFALSWLTGDYPEECSFTIAVDGETVYECADGKTLTDGQMLYVTCEHTSYTDGKCDVCGYECPHKNITDGKCDSCGTEGTFVTIDMTDSYGNGWNGNAVVIKQLVDGVYTDTEAGTATIEYGVSGTFTTVLSKDGIFALSWLTGDYPEECSFTIAVDGETVYECADGSTLTDGQMIYVTCEHTSYTDSKCDVCGYECTHESYTDSKCDACGYICTHEGQSGSCQFCGANLGKLIIDVTDDSYIKIGNGYEYYDEDGYIITGTNEDASVHVYEGTDLTLSNLTSGNLNFMYATENSVINITLDGKTEIVNVSLTKQHLVFDGGETDTLKTMSFGTSGHSGSVTVNGGNIDLVTEGGYTTINCVGGFIINGGTVTAYNNSTFVVGCEVTLNGGELNINSTSADTAAVQGSITMKKGTLLTFNAESGMLRYDSYVGYIGKIVMADGADETDCFFVRYDKGSDFVPVFDINSALDGKSYAEIKIDTHEHSFENGKCVCGYECAHEWDEGVLTRPTFESEGYYTYTCTLCGHSYTEPTKKADTTALNDASMKVMEYIGNDTLTQEASNEIHNSYLDILKNNGNIFDEVGFVRDDLVEEDQPAINAVTAELEKIIADADEKIASGEYVKADYTEIDEAITKIEQKLTDENITDEGKAGLEEIKAQLEKMKADENTSKADLAELEKELEAYEEELDKGIEDGTLVEIDVYKIGTELSDRWTERLEAEGLSDEYKDFIDNQKATDEALAAEKEIIDFMASLEGTVAENAENIAKLNEMNNSLCASFENCLRGTHNFKDYEVTSSAKCEVNAIETGTCWFCGETDEREVEGTALKHSYTKYEVTEEVECGKAGKEVASCDHGCGATDENEIPALTHKDDNGDYKCDHGCGHEFEKPVEPEQPDDPSEKCDHLCHKDGILGFLWKIISFFYRLFNIQQYCDCGVIHYEAPIFG